jgi:hypothetical protein
MDNKDVVHNYIEDNTHDVVNEEELDNNEKDMIKVYEFVDSVNLSRPKKNICRDFSDGVLIAEIIKSFKPKIVEMHNYPSSNNIKAKRENWNTLNRKVFSKLNFKLTSNDIEALINFTPGYIESVLLKVIESLSEIGIDINKHLENYHIKNQKKEENTKFKISEPVKYQQLEDEYKNQLLERDDIIDELKQALEETEKNLLISEDNKKILNHQLETLKKKVKELGLY